MIISQFLEDKELILMSIKTAESYLMKNATDSYNE